MSAGAVPSWRPLYDPHETLDQFTARRRQAYAAFEIAWREERVSVKLKGYYDQLVRAVGTNAYAWWSEAAWAEEFGVSVSTIKRVLAALVKAGLIRRERQFAGSSHTYLTAYDPVGVEFDIMEEGSEQIRGEVSAEGEVDVNTDNRYFTQQVSESIDYQQFAGSSFSPSTELTFGSVLSADSVKSQDLTPVGGETPPAQPNTQTVDAILEREGVGKFQLAPHLRQLDWAELHAIQRYLNQQRNVQDRPRLFAWLATHGFGEQLLQGTPQRDRRRRTRHATDDPLRYVSGPLAALIQGHAPDESPAAPRRVPDHDAGLAPPAVAAPPAALWPAVLTALRETCPAAEWTTWLESTALLELTDTTAVVGTPNVFARDTVRDHYCSLLHAAVQGCLGGARTIEVVIGSG
ncbi:MAG: hypothetical protein M3R24_20870 [Chloroflexota bacterium]|nr:hypothetical protein [Chloroflexota bacterium]